MTPDEQKYLLQLARRALEEYLQTKKVIQLETSELPEIFLNKKATFVTLTRNRQLRGCIGDLNPIKPLFQSVIDNSLASAFLDPRFSPLKQAEIKNIKIEISVLSSLKQIPVFQNRRQILDYFDRKKPGVFIKKNGQQATFLPQVWEELAFPKDFISQLCLKARLSPDAWEEPTTTIYEYEVEKFKETNNK